MRYHSTRNESVFVDSAQAVLEGLAPDGGLYMPEGLPAFDWQECLKGSSIQMSTQILSALLPDIPDMPELVRRAYTGKFETEDLTPTVPVGSFSMLELFRGPTSAFKDVALSMLPQLLTAAKAVKGQEKDILILTATSGDTGKAALEGFRDVPGIRICVFYPDGGVSQVQRAQMVTQEGNNVSVCAVRGNFDDAQTGVKNIFAACQGRDLPVALSSANSINIGRLAPQIMYYFRAYRDLLDAGKIRLGDEVNFSVPTGNFGDILAGYLAKRLGLPVGTLICASNANNVLTDFIRTGTYDRRRPLLKTTSPSMDILVSSNLERLLYHLSGDNDAVINDWFGKLKTDGRYEISADVKAKIGELFWAGCCSDAETKAEIKSTFENYNYLLDTHTAVAVKVYEDYKKATGDDTKTVIASTANPYKFSGAVYEAIGGTPVEDEWKNIAELEAKTGTKMPAPLAATKNREIRFTGSVEKQEMPEVVCSFLKS